MRTLILKIWRMDMKVRIYMGAVRRFFLKRRLLKMKFSLRKSHGMQYFQRHIEDHNKTEIKKMVKFCKHRLLRYSLYDDSMERSSTYRYRFFRERRGIFGSHIYLCAYCGRIMRVPETRVDHIIPVQKAGNSKFYRKMLTIRGIQNVNDVRNLAPSCNSCNSRKGAHGGIWIVRGILGKTWQRVLIREVVMLVLGGFLLYYFYWFLKENVSGYIVDRLVDIFCS